MGQYLVQMSGEVVERQNKMYTINAKNKEDAEKIAQEMFSSEYYTVEESICIESEKTNVQVVIAIVCMIISLFYSIINWKVGRKTISIAPDALSFTYAALIYAAFVIRFKGIRRTMSSWTNIISCILVILVLASLMQIILVNKTITIFGFIKIPIETKILLPLAILFSFIGVKIVYVVLIAFILLMAFCNMGQLNEAMGNLNGVIYMLTTFMGLLAYLSYEPVCLEATQSFKKSVYKGLSYTKNDFIEARGTVKGIANKIESRRNENLNIETKDGLDKE